jgi:hypothetical protein
MKRDRPGLSNYQRELTSAYLSDLHRIHRIWLNALREQYRFIEYGCYVLEDCPLPPLEKDNVAPTVAQDNYPSSGSSQDTTGQPSDGSTHCIAEEPGADMLPHPTDKGGEHDLWGKHV